MYHRPKSSYKKKHHSEHSKQNFVYYESPIKQKEKENIYKFKVYSRKKLINDMK